MKKEYERDLYAAEKICDISATCFILFLLGGFISLLLCIWGIKYSFEIFVTMVILMLGTAYLHTVMNKVCKDFKYKMLIDELTSKDNEEYIGAEGSE